MMRSWILLALAAVACTPAGPDETEPRAAVDPAVGDELSAEQRAAVEALESIGYADGSIPADTSNGVTVHDVERASAGLNLVVSAHAPAAYLMDMSGEVRHRWRRTFEEIWPGRRGSLKRRSSWRRAHVLPDGGLIAVFTSLGVVRLDRDSQVLWSFDGVAHHDLDVDPAGNVYVLTRTAHLMPEFDDEQFVLEDFVTVLSADGEELRSVSVVDCLRASEHAHLIQGIESGGDLFHTNTIELLDGRAEDRSPAFARGNVLVSVRQLDLLAVLDLDAVRAPWTRTGPWHRQHQPSLLESGNMLVLDNLSVPQRSAVIEFDPLSGAERWRYRADADDAFFTSGSGSCQRLANGNTLIIESNAGRAFELTPQKEIVWEWRSPFRAPSDETLVATLFDIVRLPADYPTSWIRE
jgi:hypothetical protein